MMDSNGSAARARPGSRVQRWLPAALIGGLLIWPMLRAWAAPPGESISAMEQQVVDLVNAERAKVGRKPYFVNYSLQDAAWKHNALMASSGCFSHQCPGEARFDKRIAATGYKAVTSGENIALGQRTAAAVMEAWMNSPPHKANILSKNFTDIGVAYDPSGPYWTQDFGAPAAGYKTVTPPPTRTRTPTPTRTATPTETEEPTATPEPTRAPTEIVEPTATNPPTAAVNAHRLFVPNASFGP